MTNINQGTLVTSLLFGSFALLYTEVLSMSYCWKKTFASRANCLASCCTLAKGVYLSWHRNIQALGNQVLLFFLCTQYLKYNYSQVTLKVRNQFFLCLKNKLLKAHIKSLLV